MTPAARAHAHGAALALEELQAQFRLELEDLPLSVGWLTLQAVAARPKWP